MKTTGDIILNQALEKVGGKGLFVKELDRALVDGRSDLSVHSLKDVPMELPKELPLLAFSSREDPRDVLVLPEGVTKIDFSKPIGCSSKRRMLQFARLYPQATFATIRGNVQTRLRRLDEGEFSATLLAAAGLKASGAYASDQPVLFRGGDDSGSRAGNSGSTGDAPGRIRASLRTLMIR